MGIPFSTIVRDYIWSKIEEYADALTEATAVEHCDGCADLEYITDRGKDRDEARAELRAALGFEDSFAVPGAHRVNRGVLWPDRS